MEWGENTSYQELEVETWRRTTRTEPEELEAKGSRGCYDENYDDKQAEALGAWRAVLRASYRKGHQC